MSATVTIPREPTIHQAHPPRTITLPGGATYTDGGQKYRFQGQVNSAGPDGTDQTFYTFDVWTEVQAQMEAASPGSFMPWVAQQIAAMEGAAAAVPAGLDGTYTVS